MSETDSNGEAQADWRDLLTSDARVIVELVEEQRLGSVVVSALTTNQPDLRGRPAKLAKQLATTASTQAKVMGFNTGTDWLGYRTPLACLAQLTTMEEPQRREVLADKTIVDTATELMTMAVQREERVRTMGAGRRALRAGFEAATSMTITPHEDIVAEAAADTADCRVLSGFINSALVVQGNTGN